MAKTNDRVAELESAHRAHERLTAALPDLRIQAERATANSAAAGVTLERHEDDALIGKASEATVKTARDRFDAAVTEERAAAARVRQAQADIVRLDQMIGQLTTEVQATRIEYFDTRQKDLARQLSEKLHEAAAINAILHENYRQAEAEFPPRMDRRGRGPAYPVAAGLTDLSWRELRGEPETHEGSRLGGWLKNASALLHPQPPAPVTRARVSHLPIAAKGSQYDAVSAARLAQEGGY